MDSLTKSINAVSSNSSTDDFVTSSSSDDNFCSDVAGSCDKLVLVGTGLSETGYLCPATPSLATANSEPQTVRRQAGDSQAAGLHYRRLYSGALLHSDFTSVEAVQ